MLAVFPSFLLRRQFATWLALLAVVAQLLLPFAHAAAMDAGVPLAWCGTGKAPTLSGDDAAASSSADAKIIVKCAICSLGSLHAIAPLPLSFGLPLLGLTSPVPVAVWQDFVSPTSFAIPPPPRGPPLIS